MGGRVARGAPIVKRGPPSWHILRFLCADALPTVGVMSEARQRMGRAAEALVADSLERRGMRIVARNARTSAVRGEIDLIALDGRALVFVEVKALRAGSVAGPERPAIAVGHRKRHKLRSLAIAWLRDHDGSVPPHGALRFDVVGLRLDSGGRAVEWEHLRGAF
jgi:putative endonuclease